MQYVYFFYFSSFTGSERGNCWFSKSGNKPVLNAIYIGRCFSRVLKWVGTLWTKCDCRISWWNCCFFFIFISTANFSKIAAVTRLCAFGSLKNAPLYIYISVVTAHILVCSILRRAMHVIFVVSYFYAHIAMLCVFFFIRIEHIIIITIVILLEQPRRKKIN